MSVKNKTFFSIIVPAYNAGKDIHKAIDSVLVQSFDNWELIIVDDCSTDNTKDVVCTYSEKNPNIKYTSLEKNSGNAKKPRDYGVSISKGDYCVMLDSDDEWSLDYLEKIYERIVEDHADVVISTMQVCDVETNHIVGVLPHRDFIMPSCGYEACKNILSSWTFAGNGIAFDKSLYKYVKDLNPYYYCYSDEMSERILVYYAKHVSLSSGVYTYWQHKESITHKCSPKLFEMLNVDMNLLEFTKKRYGQDEVDEVCISTLRHMLSLYKKYLQNYREFSTDICSNIESIFQTAYRCLQKINWNKKGMKQRVYMINFMLFKWINKCMFLIKK